MPEEPLQSLPEIPLEQVADLKQIHGLFPSAVLAGRFLRDLAWGIPPRDIDIFINTSEGSVSDELGPLCRALGASPSSRCSLSYSGASPECGDAYLLERFRKLPINLIEITLPDPTASFEEFVRRRMDFGACQITYDGLLIRMTEYANRDLRNRTFTLVRAESYEGVQRSLKRAEKFRARMPEMAFELADADAFLGPDERIVA